MLPSPQEEPCKKLCGAIPDGLTRQPFSHRRLVELDEKAFAKLLDGGQPVGPQAQRRPVHGKLGVFKIAISRSRRGLKAGEAVEATQLAQPMDDDEVADRSQKRTVIRVPCTSGQGFGTKERARLVIADCRLAAREDIKFRQLRRQRCILITATAQLLQAAKDIVVGVTFEGCSQR